jgi:hypothetical protein
MSSLNLRRIARPDVLRTITFDHLVRLLRTEAGAFIGGHVDLDASQADFDFDGLGELFLNPPEDFPGGLADALHHIQEMEDEDGMALLLEVAPSSVTLSLEEPSGADVACRMWLDHRELLIEVHARRLLLKTKRFVTRRGRPTPMPELTEEKQRELAAHLDGWFAAKHKGENCVRITTSKGKGATWLMIRHGLAVDRRSVIRGGKSASSVERPEKYDVVSYIESRGELSVHAANKGERSLYRTAIGRFLFGDPEYFIDDQKFTFAPLAADDPSEALFCGDIDGIEEVLLKAVAFKFGAIDATERAPKDLLGSWSEKRRAKLKEFVEANQLKKVTLMFRFSDSRKARQVVIEPPDVASYTRDTDEDRVNAWLEARKFIVPTKPDETT